MNKPTKSSTKDQVLDTVGPLNACENERGIRIKSIVFDKTDWGRCVELHTDDKRVIVTLAKCGPAAKAHYRRLHVEADRFGSAEKDILRLATALGKAEGKEVHIFRNFKRRKDGTIRGFDVMFILP